MAIKLVTLKNMLQMKTDKLKVFEVSPFNYRFNKLTNLHDCNTC